MTNTFHIVLLFVIQVEPLKYTLINALFLLEIDDLIVYNTINRMNRQAVTNKSSKSECVCV